MMEMMKSDLPLFTKIEIFTGNYIDAFTENPFVPGFIMHELSRDPSKIANHGEKCRHQSPAFF